MQVRKAVADDLEQMVRLAASQQVDGSRHIGYLGSDVESIATDITAVDVWTARTAVAVDESGRLIGWLLAESDDDMGRAWWWGPFVEDGNWAEIADRLYRLSPDLTDAREEELAPDTRNSQAADFAQRHGFVGETASAVLSYRGGGFGGRSSVLALDDEWKVGVARLHDALFPGTHTTGDSLVASDDVRLVVVEDGELIGYVAAEVHSDGSGYIDYLGVSPAARRRGVGRWLVEGAADVLLALGASSVDLTVRESNHAARALYVSLGFTEERLVRPFRKGFTLDPGTQEREPRTGVRERGGR
jgi:ribosomal protein S18 acetylase RimI-like enzyme